MLEMLFIVHSGLLAEFFPCLEQWNVVIISLGVVAAEVPRFGLQLSCFGHVRAKTNSELPCRLELCLTFGLGIIPGCWILHRAVKGCFSAGVQWLSPWDVLAWPICEGLLNPAALVAVCAPWLCISLQLTLIPEESFPARG